MRCEEWRNRRKCSVLLNLPAGRQGSEIHRSERRKKEFLWRGYSMDELKLMPLYPRKRIRRHSVSWRCCLQGPEDHMPRPFRRMRETSGEVRQHLRHGTNPLPWDVHCSLHGGTDCWHSQWKEFVKVEIQPEMIGHAMGEYAPTENLSSILAQVWGNPLLQTRGIEVR